MSIFHLNASNGSRAGGQSAAAKSDYVLREGRYDGDAAEVVYSMSGHMPAWAEDSPRDYWVATDKHERVNALLFRHVEFALPREFTPDERIAAAREKVAYLTDDPQLPYTMAIHAGRDDEGRDHNPHCHVMYSLRGLDGHDRDAETWFKRANSKNPAAGGARKHNGYDRTVVPAMRKKWAEIANAHLAAGGYADRIDHRSHADRGIKQLPQIHLGAYANQLRQGRPVHGEQPNYARVERYRHIETLQIDVEVGELLPDVHKEAVRESRAALAAEARTETHAPRTLHLLDDHAALVGYLSGKFGLQEAFAQLEADERALAQREQETDRVRGAIEREPEPGPDRPPYIPPDDRPPPKGKGVW